MNVGQLILSGLISGTVIALPAISVSLIFAVLRFPNFAIGAMFTAGAYCAYFLNVQLGLPILAAGLGAAGVTAGIGVASDRLVYRPLRGRSGITLMVASIGITFVIVNVIRFIYGNDLRALDVPVSRALRLAGLRITPVQIWAVVIVIGTVLILHVMLTHTRLGRSIRAVADNAPLAAVRGIKVDRVLAWVWAITGVLASVGGIIVALDSSIRPSMGWPFLVHIFTAAILGGIGKPSGAVVGALALGVVGALSTLILPSAYRMAIAFLILVVVLLFRPWGLFGRKEIRK